MLTGARLEDRVRGGVLVGGLVAAVVLGALVGYGAGGGDPARHLNAAAGLLLDSRVDFLTGVDPVATSLGLLLVAAASLALAVPFAVLAAGLRGAPLLAAAALASALAFCMDTLVLPRLAGMGTPAGLEVARLVWLHLLVAATLALGMRLAFGRDGSTEWMTRPT